ncbi:MAG: two-component system, OmpR family, sensor histidine kinase KdpD [Thermoleophilaceae bacterium]|nr:two-component system, OmpR family, sensor histidine kinase KdpD [Thermoleophilaceae bacterium]
MSTHPPITHVRAEDLLGEGVPSTRTPGLGIGLNRRLAGAALTAGGLPLLTFALAEVGDGLTIESKALIYLLAVVAVALVGGVVAAVISALLAAVLINYFFVQPVHTLDIARQDQALALVVFIVVGVIVSMAVEVAARRGRAAARAAAEAETISALAGTDLAGEQTLQGVLERARQTFGMESVLLKGRAPEDGEWVEIERAGWPASRSPAPLRFDVPIGDVRLVGRGPALFAEDQRVLNAFAAAAETAYAARDLSAKAREAQALAAVDRQRTALLAGAGHDLRTPLAGIKAAVSSLRQTDVQWSEQDHADLLETIESSADRLAGIVDNLLDSSRLEAGELGVRAGPVAIDEVIAAAALGVPGSRERLVLDVPEGLPPVQADPGLLERIFVNILDNAVRHGGEGSIEVFARAGERSAKITVSDSGPGVPDGQRERLFDPFQHVDDRSPGGGLGLGLSVARGFAEAMDGTLIADRSETGGLLLRLRLPLAQAPPEALP